MANNKEHIEDVFKRLADLKVKPSNEVWTGIEAQLKANNSSLGWFTLKYAVGFVAILVLAVGILMNLLQYPLEPQLTNSSTYQNIYQQYLLQFSNEKNSAEPLNLVFELETTLDILESEKAYVSSASEISKNQEEKSSVVTEKSKLRDQKQHTTTNHQNSESIAEVSSPFINSMFKLNLLKEDYQLQVEPLRLTDVSLSSSSSSEKKQSEDLDLAALENHDFEGEESVRFLSRFSITPGVSPIFSGGNSASSFSQEMSETTQGTTNMSFGLQLAYKVTEKLSVRTGIHQVGTGFQTDNMVISYQSRPGEISTISTYANTNISLMDTKTFSEEVGPNSRAPFDETSLNQELGFIEIPMEAAYQFIDEKIGVSLIGGMSTLFLNHNNVVANLQEESFIVGQSNNVNSTSFSANFGVGLDYKFTEKLKFNLEPSLRYQINTFDTATTDFRPYFIGIFSGIKFEF